MPKDMRFIDEEIASYGGHFTTLHCDECDIPFEVSDDIANEILMLKAQEGDPIVCSVCIGEDEIDFLKAIFIDKSATHYQCPMCRDILWTMTDGSILPMSASLVCELYTGDLPANFDPEVLPQKCCRPCIVEVALSESGDESREKIQDKT